MSQFYGTLTGQAGEATRRGSKNSGLQTAAAGWGGAIKVRLYQSSDGNDCYLITHDSWQSGGEPFVVARGVIGKASDCEVFLAGQFVPAYPGKDAVIGAVLNPKEGD